MISPKTLAAIRERTDIVAIVAETVKLVHRGRAFVGLCPFHKEKTPSFSVNQERGFFYCFGCKEKGNVFDFVMKTEGLSFPEAARKLAESSGVELEETATDLERREAEAARRAIDDLYAVNQLAAYWFETQLREHPRATFATDELCRRGLDPRTEGPVRDALSAFRIGYAPPGWTGLADYLAGQGVSPVSASKVGLIAARKSGPGHYDWFRHRLMFPILDVQARVVGFSGRVLADPETGVVDPKSPKYINSPESSIYQKGSTLFGLHQAKQAIRQEGEAVLVEGNFDVVSLHAHGFTRVVAPLGTAFTQAQAKLLRRYAPNVILLFDGDSAGRKATREARDTCHQTGLIAKVGILGDAKDPDEFIRARGAAALGAALGAARGILEHLVETTLDEASNDAQDRAHRIKTVAALIASEDDPTVRELGKTYANRVAQRLGFGTGAAEGGLATAVMRAIQQATPSRDDPAEPPGSRPRPADPSLLPPWQVRSRPDEAQVALNILGCFLDFPDLLESPDAETAEALQFLEGDAALGVAGLRGWVLSGANGGGTEALAHLPGSIHTFAASRLAAPRHERREDAQYELLRNAQKLKRLGLSRQNAQVVEALQRNEPTGDRAADDELMREADRRAREKRGLSRGMR